MESEVGRGLFKGSSWPFRPVAPPRKWRQMNPAANRNRPQDICGSDMDYYQRERRCLNKIPSPVPGGGYTGVSPTSGPRLSPSSFFGGFQTEFTLLDGYFWSVCIFRSFIRFRLLRGNSEFGVLMTMVRRSGKGMSRWPGANEE